MNNSPRPINANPATPIPITEPPAKLISNALDREDLAACAVLTLALVAILIPINPANPENIAPIMNATTMSGWELSLFILNKPKSTEVISTNTANILYSACKNAIAPLAI